MKSSIMECIKSGSALAMGLALLASPAMAQMEGVAGTIVDQKGYKIRNVIVAGDGLYDTTDLEGKFGTGRGPVVGVRGIKARSARALTLAGSTLRFNGLGLGATLKAELLLASGRRAGNSVSLSTAGGRADLDLNALSAGLPREGLYVLKAEAGNGAEHHLLARLGDGSWALSTTAVNSAIGRTSGGNAALRKSAAPPTTLRISKPGYQEQNIDVPQGGELGEITLKLDAASSVVEAPFDLAPLWYPTGWMGDHGSVKATDETVDVRPNDPDAKCTKWVYQVDVTDTNTIPLGWSAVAYQYPESNWGTKSGRQVTGASKITFWARGAVGGELVDFKSGNSSYMTPPEPGMYKDTYGAAISASLTSEWMQYEIPLDGSNTSQALTGFVWATTMGMDGAAVTFYIDEVRFE